MNNLIGTVVLRCMDECCMLVIDKYKHGDYEYNISIQDSYLYGNHNTISGRIKRALKALFGKPIYYNDIWITDEDIVLKFRDEHRQHVPCITTFIFSLT